MNIRIKPKNLKGKLKLPSSKSVSHRALLAAALADGESRIKGVLDCDDTDATLRALFALGAETRCEGDDIIVKGISKPPKVVEVDCKESGSTLRFIIPIAAALGAYGIFEGSGRLPERPITPYITEFEKKGVSFEAKEMPYRMKGQLESGRFYIDGDISSQFITGLLFALPLLNGDSEIILTSPLESRPYIDLTIQVLNKFGIEILSLEDSFFIKGNQRFQPKDFEVEGDYSQAGFFLVSNMLGSEIELLNISEKSMQGDRVVVDIINDLVKYRGTYSPLNIDARDIPDIVPILTVLACFADGTSNIRNCGRLRIKESDRLEAVTNVLNSIGADIYIENEGLVINGVKSFTGGICDSFNDHRIAMMLAIAAQKCEEPLIITNSECVAKSYPTFFEDLRSLGGELDVVIL
ncbi:MAG: 3-phosphoshikimate 1-carboxyvinyltransferase [Clostridiales bacterium]|nr:3-phosphoshikimate 1-carboxyvinyltransferase [Clostridiales bacterium]